MVRTDGHTLSEKRNYQVTNSMFGASRKKFVEGVDSDYHDENMYYSQSSMFPHRSEKDMLASPSTSGQLSQFGASLYGQQSALGLPMRGMSNNTPQLNRSLSQGTQLPSHVTPTTGVPTMSLHTPPSPSRGILPMNPRNMMNHSQVGQGIGIPSRTNSMSSSGLGSPSRSSPSIICMPKQQPSRQPFTVNSMSGFGMNRNQAFGMNNSLSSNIFNGTDGSENVTGLDLSDFPALADRNRREGSGNPTPLINPLAGRAPYGPFFHPFNHSRCSPWTISSFSISFLNCGAPNWILFSNKGLTNAKYSGRITSQFLHVLHLLHGVQENLK
uniref:CCR4-NOT transcription complex subunit 2 n=1 Tax=Sus scrofa TaxID=9823 RepID=A0A8D0VVY9_PIG